MQPRWIVAAAAFAAVALGLAGCGLSAGGGALSDGAATSAPTVSATGYAEAAVSNPTGPVTLHVSLLTSGASATAAWRAMTRAVAATEAALVAAGASRAGLGVAGAPSLTAQVGPAAVEVTQTVTADLPTMAPALALLGRTRIGAVDGFNGYYLTVDAPALPSPSALATADTAALAQARARAAALAAAQGRQLGALVSSTSAILASVPCAPVGGCSDAAGDLTPAPASGHVVVSVRATYSLAAGRST